MSNDETPAPAAVKTVRDIMNAEVPTVAPGDAVETVIRLLREHGLPGVPVVNDGGRCVGIITEEDLIIASEGTDIHLPHYVEIMGGVVFLEPMKRFEERIRKAFAALAEDLMTADPITIEPDATVAEAARVIARKHHNRLPVVEHGRYLGVVTRADVLAALVGD